MHYGESSIYFIKEENMRYGIYVAYWLKEWSADYYGLIEKAGKLGFDCLEISCAALIEQYASNADLEELKKRAEDNGITLTAGYGPPKQYDLSSSDSEITKNALRFYRDILSKLGKLGITIVGGGLYSYWPVDYSLPIDKKRDWDNSVRNMREVAKYAEDNGVVMGMEVLNRFEGYLLNTCVEACRYTEEVGSPNVQVMLDTFHMNIEEDDMGGAIRLAGKRLCHFHAGEQNRQVPGKGRMPWHEIGTALNDIEYDKAVVMEPFVMPGGTVGRDIKVFRDIVSDTKESSLDRDARASVEFLRHVFGS